MFFHVPMQATYPAHPMLLDLITLIFGTEYKLQSFSLSNFIYPSVTAIL